MTTEIVPPGKMRAGRSRSWVFAVLLLSIASIAVLTFRDSGWGHYQKELAANGEHLDWKHFIPPPLNDEENFYAAPGIKELFQQPAWILKDQSNAVHQPIVWRLPQENPRWKELKASEPFVKGPQGIDYPRSVLIAWEKENQTLITNLLQALKRPKARLVTDFSKPLHADQPSPNFRFAVQTLITLAKAYISSNEPDKAIRYMEATAQMASYLENGTSLIETMMHCAVMGVYVDSVRLGLEQKVWTDDHLRALHAELAVKDLLTPVANSLRAERAFIIELTKTMPFRRIHALFRWKTWPTAPTTTWQSFSQAAAGIFHGFRFGIAREENLLNYAQLHQEALASIDARADRIFPDRAAAYHARQHLLKSDGSRQYVLIDTAGPSFFRVIEITAQNANRVKQASLACALELHRRARGQFPTSLTEIPSSMQLRDVITGSSFLYSVTAPDESLLYSVGWNRLDDKGDVTNDWVWGLN